MKKITQERAEEAVANIINLQRKIKELEASKKISEQIIDCYSRERVPEFVDDKLVCGIGIIQIKAGTAKPIDAKTGKSISKTLREKLALLLPSKYVSQTIDSKGLYDCDDKIARQILRSNGINIVRDDKYIVI